MLAKLTLHLTPMCSQMISLATRVTDESGPMPVPKSSPVVSGCRHHRLRMLIDHLMCRDGKLKELLQERRAVKTLAARRIYQSVVGTFLKCVKERVILGGRRSI